MLGGGGVDEIENKAEAQPAWLQLAAGAGSWALTELGNIHSVNILTFLIC